MTFEHDLVFSALADPTRREILSRLSQGEVRVTELAKPFSMSLNAISKHVRVLEKAALVNRRQLGREHYLRLNSEPLDQAISWLDAQRSFWKSQLEGLDEMLREETR